MLVNSAWKNQRFHDMDIIKALPVLVVMTRENLPDFTRMELADLTGTVHEALQALKDERGWSRHAIILLIDAALPIVQGLYDELSPYAEHPSASQHNDAS